MPVNIITRKKKTRIPLRRHQEILLREASVRLITRLTADTLLETEEYKRISQKLYRNYAKKRELLYRLPARCLQKI